MNFKSYTYVFLLILSLASCNNNDLNYESLANEYLQQFSEKNWELLYKCKSERFKNKVSYDFYYATMEKYTDNYFIKSWNIKKHRVVEKDGRKLIGIIFHFTLVSSKTNKDFISMDDEQIWEIDKSKNRICLDLGMGAFYPLNKEIP
jgi:hypothetical protein